MKSIVSHGVRSCSLSARHPPGRPTLTLICCYSRIDLHCCPSIDLHSRGRIGSIDPIITVSMCNSYWSVAFHAASGSYDLCTNSKVCVDHGGRGEGV